MKVCSEKPKQSVHFIYQSDPFLERNPCFYHSLLPLRVIRDITQEFARDKYYPSNVGFPAPRSLLKPITNIAEHRSSICVSFVRNRNPRPHDQYLSEDAADHVSW